MDYWRECIEIAFADAGIVATEGQIETVVGAVEGSHENYGMAFGHDVASLNFRAAEDREKENIEDALLFEKEKVVCPACSGRGLLISRFGTMQSDGECYKCRGDGKVHPTKL
jgi:hypothetical protein